MRTAFPHQFRNLARNRRISLCIADDRETPRIVGIDAGHERQRAAIDCLAVGIGAAHPVEVFRFRHEVRQWNFVHRVRFRRLCSLFRWVCVAVFEFASRRRVGLAHHCHCGPRRVLQIRLNDELRANGCGWCAGEFCVGLKVRDELFGSDSPVTPEDFADAADHRIIFVVVSIATDNEGRFGGVAHRSGLFFRFTVEFAVHVKLHPFAIVNGGHVVPAARLVFRRTVQVRDFPFATFAALCSKSEVEVRLVETDDEPFLLRAVVLEAAEECAPFGGLVDANPGDDRERVFGQKVCVRCHCGANAHTVVRITQFQASRVFVQFRFAENCPV